MQYNIYYIFLYKLIMMNICTYYPVGMKNKGYYNLLCITGDFRPKFHDNYCNGDWCHS